jgi:methyl-accepting chemotaxis protein
MNDMREQLGTLVGEVLMCARQVSDTSSQIAEGNNDLAERTEEQATSLEEAASSLEELTSTVALNAEHAREAAKLAQHASSVATAGGDLVAQVVSTMGEITQSSRRIEDIIAVIDDIAFQTNLLSLNAAVEAARAGEQGRGFAVVASEVRNLAQRSASAAREIKSLIGESVGRVEAGMQLVNRAGQTSRDVVAAVSEVTGLVASIAEASAEQSSGIAQVNSAVAQMDGAVQQNAALVEEARAGAASMEAQASALMRAVSRFRIGADLATAPEMHVLDDNGQPADGEERREPELALELAEA